ncbi:MAG: deoxynucleoside kinase [Alphaproteobacteria bacterium]|nr:deoxynucleoside kinase [Alphaproteobacteria bacterium]
MPTPPRSNYIVIEGLIGVGKTSLCKLLQDRWEARLVLEPWAENPFLARFYEDPERFAFPAQMFYLATRYSQQLNIRQGDLFEPLVVSDYLFEKDALFAQKTLGGHELELYEQFAALLSGGVPRPDMVVFLDAPIDKILTRIAKRGIESESKISRAYLEDLRERYLSLWAEYTAAPVHILETSDLNYVNDENDREAVLGILRGWLDGHPNSATPASAKAEWEVQPGLFPT